MGLNTETSAALVFLILYTILFVILLIGYLTRRLKLRSRYGIIMSHVTIRLASQATGIAFGVVGNSGTGLLVAYFVLGAEGYLTLVLCTYRFLILWHYHNNNSHDSWLEPRHPPGMPLFKRFRDALAIFAKPVRPMAIIHNFLIGANTLIIVGGSMLAGGHKTVSDFHSNLAKDKAMRVTGQAIFFSVNVYLLYCIIDTIHHHKCEHPARRVHPTLSILLAVWPLLIVRGLYGILSAIINDFNYFSPSSYGEHGLTDNFVISEYILGTAMEWTSCVLLMTTYYTSRNDPEKEDLKEWGDVGKEGHIYRLENLDSRC